MIRGLKEPFFILLISAFSAMLGLGVISPFLPEFARQHGANGFWLGMIFAGFGLSRGLVMPLIGALSDRLGRKVFVVSGLFLFSVISLFYPLAGSVYSLTLVRMVHGLSAGMIIPIVMAYAGDVAPSGREGSTAGSVTAMFYMGLAAGPLMGGVIAENFGFNAVFYSMSGLAALNTAVVAFFLPDTGRRKRTDSVPRSPGFSGLIRYNYIKAILVLAFIGTLLLAVFMSFLPVIGERDMIDTVHIGIIVSMGIFIAGIFQMPFGKLSDSLDRTGKLFQVSTGTSIGLFALFSIPFCPDFHALLVSGCFLGAGAGVSTPALSGLSFEIGHKAGMGRWMGIYNAAMSAGFVAAPVISGLVLDTMGIDSVFYVFGIFAFFCVLLSGHYYRRRLKYGIKAG
ncbi:MAG: MFS transporter [Candidatus Omnitrophica bacterium]|nr:MFS transporter [Candidatus Omnitrophota bacterium]